MIDEKQLIEKIYYHNFLDEKTKPTAEVLGQIYFDEQKKIEDFDLSYIRFAQGELYYHYKDYETAIFKWENINNELEQWAHKNIGDAYYKLGLISAAEEKYTSINSGDPVLAIEVYLNLFYLYQENNNLENAYEILSKALQLNADYPNVTKIARNFYEQQDDIEHAVKLAIKESIRTEQEEWFSTLISYVKAGHSKQFEPGFFAEALLTFYEVDEHAFIQLVEALWHRYKETNYYLSWIRTVNDFFYSIDVEITNANWRKVVDLFESTFLQLTSGSYYLSELHSVIPNLLSNWLSLSENSDGLLPSATVLAWNEIFPGTILPDAVYNAESIIFEAENNDSGLDIAVELFHAISKWALKHSINIDKRQQWLLDEVTKPHVKNHFLLAGNSGSGKTTFVQSLVGDKILPENTSSFVFIEDNDVLESNRINSQQVQTIKGNQYLDVTVIDQEIYQIKRPCILLHEHQCVIIDSPPIRTNGIRQDFFDLLPLVDGLLYVVDGSIPFSDHEFDFLSQIKNVAPNIQVHFILNKVDLISSDEETRKRIDMIKSTIQSIYPGSDVLPYSSLHPFNEQYTQLNSFLSDHYPYDEQEKQEKRTAKVLTLVHNLLAELLQKRVDMEKGLIDSIQWHEDLLGRMNGFSNKLNDLTLEKGHELVKSYRTLLDEGRDELKATIPMILKETAELIKDDSDFKKVHLTINDEMNAKLKEYFEGIFLPGLCDKFENWLKDIHDVLLDSQTYLIEMKESFKELYQIDKLALECEFSILEDWHRDLNRMAGRIQYEKENILLKRTPTQILLKGAGKLFGAMNQNKAMMANQYRKYIENESYEEVITSITKKVFLPFELFEKGIHQDIHTFYHQPAEEVGEIITETEAIIADSKEELNEMKVSPHFFYDPLKLFEVNLLQQEFILQAKKDYSRSR
ncbi:GTPase domain-containing protein [Metabacillus malikii]|uniref:GTPase SAR1 family protein n=1 Tax=Metabacillus malikii TaxID=1504265 RepID=A0ABT9ZET2_9BACI|nr:GTP-binding protein [Metabacillus malikii]MDQ0230787.1 GTPase SAR1 family protein [Metabacillus malikii]